MCIGKCLGKLNRTERRGKTVPEKAAVKGPELIGVVVQKIIQEADKPKTKADK